MFLLFSVKATCQEINIKTATPNFLLRVQVHTIIPIVIIPVTALLLIELLTWNK